MIIREILHDESLIKKFDFFNDAQNTLWWLAGINSKNAKKIHASLTLAYENWKDIRYGSSK